MTFLVPIGFAITVPAEAVTSRLDWQTLARGDRLRDRARGLHALVLALRPQELHGRVRVTEPKAQTWHYGLMARWWAEFNLDGPEIDWFRPFVEAGQPALDAACGTGRLLVPYLAAGFDVDGSDISPDMLGHVRERCEREGIPPPNLYAQAMHELDLPRRYRTIIVCGGFGLGGHREHDVEGLRRIYEHLEPGGTFVARQRGPLLVAAMGMEVLEERRSVRSCRASTARKATAGWRPMALSSSSARALSTSIPSPSA